MRRRLRLACVPLVLAAVACGGAAPGDDLGVWIPPNDATPGLDPGPRDDLPGADRPDALPQDLPGADPDAGPAADAALDAAPDVPADPAGPPDEAPADPGPDPAADVAPEAAADLPPDPYADPGADAGADLPEDPGIDPFLDPGVDVPPAEPGLAIPGAIYPHTSYELFVWNGTTTPPQKVANFAFPADGLDHTMTDMAIDYHGRLYGVTFGGLYRCMADTAKCTKLAALDEQFNGMTIVPAGTIQPAAETIVAISNAGGWYRVQVSGTQAVLTHQGDYGSGYTSAGDAYAIAGSGTWAAVNNGLGGTLLVQVDPVTGAVQQELGTIPGDNIYGLAGYRGKVYAFDSSGTIYQGDPTGAATFQSFLSTSHAWYGAAVSTFDPH